MRDFRDQIDIAGVTPDGVREDGGKGGRPWLGVRFTCAGAYLRVYRNPSGDAYTARCPRCGRCVNFRVGPGGSNERFFEVRC